MYRYLSVLFPLFSTPCRWPISLCFSLFFSGFLSHKWAVKCNFSGLFLTWKVSNTLEIFFGALLFLLTIVSENHHIISSLLGTIALSFQSLSSFFYNCTVLQHKFNHSPICGYLISIQYFVNLQECCYEESFTYVLFKLDTYLQFRLREIWWLHQNKHLCSFVWCC